MKITHPVMVEVNKILAGRAFIAGGAIRSSFEGQDPKDIDIFMLTACSQTYEEVCRELYDALGKEEEYAIGLFTVIPRSYEQVVEGLHVHANYYAFDFDEKETGITISIIVPQVMYGRNTFGTIEQVVSEIDLDICRWGVNPDNTIYCPDDARDNIRSIITRTMKLIVVRSEEEATRTAKRIAKYEGYGYTLVTKTPPVVPYTKVKALPSKVKVNKKLTKVITNREKARQRRDARKGKKNV